MSLLDSASLICTPNGYKEGKLYSVIPSDGSGDMSVVRATTATRVNSAGLVELVPYNLVQYSEQFDNAAWTKINSTVTANTTTAPNGTLTAETWQGNGTANVHQLISSTTTFFLGYTYTYAIYVKKGTNNFIQFLAASTIGGMFANFDLNTGVVGTLGTVTGSNPTSDITSLGDDWYRCSMTFTATSSQTTSISCILTSSSSSVRAESNSLSTNVFLWGAQLNEGSTALPYQKTETRLNIPRLDYSNGTCPSLLVEPQRTNLALYSSSFDNAAWISAEVTLTSGQSSPQGINNAFKITGASATNAFLLQLGIPVTSGNTYTASVYLKGTTSGSVSLRVDSGSTAPNNPVSYTTEWQRFTYTFTAGSTTATAIIGGYNTWTGSEEIFVYGFQLELGSYATSYIPTTSASVTRNADVISKTGISSLIGQTEGTLFVDINWEQKNGVYFVNSISNGTTSNEIFISFGNSSNNALRFSITSGGSTSVVFNTSALTSGRYKIALAYANNDATGYINGTQIFTDSSVSVPATSQMKFSRANDTLGYSGTMNAAVLWQTRLTNDELATLTTI